MATTLAALARRIATLERRLADLSRASRLAHSSIEDGAVQVYDGDGSLRAIVGRQPDGTAGVTAVNGPVPPTPSQPNVEPALAALRISWDGTFTDGLTAPLDFARTEIHVGPDADFTPDQSTLRDTIETAQGGDSVVPLPYTTWWVRLRTRTTSGTPGAAGTAVSGTPRRAAAADIQAGTVTADLLAADAVTGKTITGGEIHGSHITGVEIDGAALRTATTGSRVEITATAAGEAEPATGQARFYSGAAQESAPAAVYAVFDHAANRSKLTVMSAELTDPDDPPDGTMAPRSAGTPWPMAALTLGSTPEAAHVDLDADAVTAAGDFTVHGDLTGRRVSLDIDSGPVNPRTGGILTVGTGASDRLALGNLGIGCTNGSTWTDLTLNRTLTVTADGYLRHENDWLDLPLEGDARVYDPARPPMFRISPTRMLEFSGLIGIPDQKIKAGTVIAQLPEVHRPAAVRPLIVASTSGRNTVLRTDINAAGEMKLYVQAGTSPTATWIGLDGISCHLG